MSHYVKSIAIVAGLFVLVLGVTLWLFPVKTLNRTAAPIETTTWEQLLPPEQATAFDDWAYVDSLTDAQLDQMWIDYETLPNQVMDGKRIQLPGFMVSLDLDTSREVTEFIFVPYQGACIHTPPPPPNQTILVSAPQGTKVWDNWIPVVVTGDLTIETTETDIAAAGYKIMLDSIKPYEYEDEQQATQAAEQAQTAAGAHTS